MQSDYKPFLNRLIDKYEGGYGWDKADTGGPTKYGITCYDLAEHRGQKMTSMAAWAPIVKAMTRAEAETIYGDKYATRIGFADLPAGVDCCMMDYAVNSGYARAVRVACAMVGHPAREVMTPPLLAKIKAMDPQQFVVTMCAERLKFMHAIRNGSAWARYGDGWGARVADLKRYCLALVNSGPVPDVAPDVVAPVPKVRHPKPSVTKVVKTNGAATATAAAAHAAGVPWGFVMGIIIGIVLASVAIYLIQKHHAELLNMRVDLPDLKAAAQKVEAEVGAKLPSGVIGKIKAWITAQVERVLGKIKA